MEGAFLGIARPFQRWERAAGDSAVWGERARVGEGAPDRIGWERDGEEREIPQPQEEAELFVSPC